MSQKSENIDRLNRIEDKATLSQIDSWLEAFLEEDEQETFEASKIQAVQEGYEQYLSIKVLSQEEASKRFELWPSQKEK